MNVGPARALEFPPLLKGYAVVDDPLLSAVAAAEKGIDPGAVFYGSDEGSLRAAIVLAPEEPLGHAVRVCFAVSLGIADAIGALAPPEVAVHLVWPAGIRVNGAMCGYLTVVSSTSDAEAEPDWIVIGVSVPIRTQEEKDPGADPDSTSLAEEGCSELSVLDLTEAWARHMMNWLHIYLTDGFEPLHREWLAKSHARETGEAAPFQGQFVGLDEFGGLLVKSDETTRVEPLIQMVDCR